MPSVMRMIAERILGEFAGAPGARRANHTGDTQPRGRRFDNTMDPVQDSVDLQRRTRFTRATGCPRQGGNRFSATHLYCASQTFPPEFSTRKPDDPVAKNAVR